MVNLFIKYTSVFFLFIAISWAEIDPNILRLNQEIEEVFFAVQSYQFDKSYQKINNLISECNKLDYLIGESELLILKLQQAIALGEEDLIYQWEKEYYRKAEQSITYGMIDKELYYKFLSLTIKVRIDGFEYQREALEKLREQARRNKNHATEAYILYSLFINLSDDDKDEAENRLEQIFSEYNDLKPSWTYVAYQNIKGVQTLLKSEDREDINERFPLSLDIETIMLQASQQGQKENYKEALDLLLEANKKEPNHPIIIDRIVSTYLFLNIKEPNIDYLNQAEYYGQKGLEIAPDYEILNYNLACLYSQKNQFGPSLYHFERSLELGNTNYDWIMEDPDLSNFRKSLTDWNGSTTRDVIAKYDKYTIAYNCFSEVEKYSKELRLEKTNLISQYRKQGAYFLSYGQDQSKVNFEKIMTQLKKIKEIYIDLYLEEILSLSQGILESGNYDEAEPYLTEYIKISEELFDEKYKYMENVFNSSIGKANIGQSLEEFKATKLSRPYNDLAEINLKQSDTEAFFKNMKQSVYFSEVLGTSDYLLIDKYTLLATEYSKIEDIDSSKKYISKAERRLRNMRDIEGIVLSTLTIVDYYFDYGVENIEILFRKKVRLLNDALEEMDEQAENYQFQYDCLVRLACSYSIINKNKELQYEYFNRADSLLLLNKLTINNRYMGTWFYGIFSDYGEFERLRRLTTHNFEYHFSNGNYRKAYEYGFEPLYLYVFKKEGYNDRDYFTLNDMLRRFDNTDQPQLWSLKFKIKKWQIEIIKNESKKEYDKSLILIPQLISMKDNIFVQNDRDLHIAYLWLGKILLKHSSLTENTSQFQELLTFIEPLQWEDRGIVGDNWFLYFIDGTWGPLNKDLYNKYITRILSYPLTSERLTQKIIYGNRLISIWSDFNESIRVYEEALLEAKHLGDLEMQLYILRELAYRYGSNRQHSLSKRRYFEARELAIALGYDDQLEIILVNMLDQIIGVSDPQYYELSSEYLALSRKMNSYQGQIQAIGFFLDYFQSIQEPDSAIHYMLKGFALKDSVVRHISSLRYLSYVSICFQYINNDKTREIVSPITNWVFNGIKIEDPKLQKIYNEMIYLKDFDFSTLNQKNINEYPFVYNNTLKESNTLKEYWDSNYLQTKEFENNIEFLLSLDGKHKEFGLINTFWGINGRIKDLESVPSGGADKYFGFGLKFDSNTTHHGLEVTSVFFKSPSIRKLNIGDVVLIDSDEELSVEYAKDFMASKINEADVMLNKPAQFTVLRKNTDTLSIYIMPGDVQPNFYSEYPVKEAQYLIKMFFDISDSLLQTAENIQSYTGFSNSYRDFLVRYPRRYYYTHDSNEISSEGLAELLNRYESISTYNLVNESIEHKINLENNPLLLDEYHKYSNRINGVQLELQKSGLNDSELGRLHKVRNTAYEELKYFENFSLEKSTANKNAHQFSFQDNLDLFNEFDYIFRFCAGSGSIYGALFWEKEGNQFSVFETYPENEIAASVKAFTQLLPYSVVDTSLTDKMASSLLDLFTKINNSYSVPIFEDDFKNKEYNVLVIPERSMNFFPWELMPVRFESDTTQYYYFGEFANVTYAPSLSSYVQFANRENKKKIRKKALLVSANPNTESTTNYTDNLLTLRSEYGNIEFVDNEVNTIDKTLSKRKWFKKGFTTKVFDSDNISELQFKSSDIEQYKYIHIAAHGVHDDENPKYSGILLGRNENDNEDGILQNHEIYPLNLNADLVTLSSCFSGFGEIDPNEGNMGIYRSFLIAGAKSVIISLWNVEDESTSILFTKFYEKLKEGKSKAESLRLAKMHLKNKTRFDHPFYWAPFILMGES
mgnify:CR=1 FL=1